MEMTNDGNNDVIISYNGMEMKTNDVITSYNGSLIQTMETMT